MARSSYTRQSILFPSTAPAAAAATTTVTVETASSSNQPPPPPPQITDSLVLKLKRPKKRVSWKEGTVDNEFMNKKSSKKCCIFHKEKPFDEDDSDSEGDCNHDRGNDGTDNYGKSNQSHGGDGNSCHVP